MTSFRIDCVIKPHRSSPHEHITEVGGPRPDGNGRWKDPVANVIYYIESNQHSFYTHEGGKTAQVGVRTSAAGNKFLQTHADGYWADNLLALSSCP